MLASCGDGFVHFEVEACDDGGASVSCNADCSLAACGDSIVNNAAGEACDEGEMAALYDADCTLAECGDSTLSPLAGEECDDGSLSDNDGCSSECKKLACTIFITCRLYTWQPRRHRRRRPPVSKLAQEAGLPGVFYAWLSGGAIAPSNRFVKSSVPYVLATGIMVAKNWTDLTDGMILHAIDTTGSKGAAPITPPAAPPASRPSGPATPSEGHPLERQRLRRLVQGHRRSPPGQRQGHQPLLVQVLRGPRRQLRLESRALLRRAVTGAGWRRDRAQRAVDLHENTTLAVLVLMPQIILRAFNLEAAERRLCVEALGLAGINISAPR